MLRKPKKQSIIKIKRLKLNQFLFLSPVNVTYLLELSQSLLGGNGLCDQLKPAW